MWKSLQGTNAPTYYTMKSQGLMLYDMLDWNHQCIRDLFKKQADVDTIIKEISEHYAVVPETLCQETYRDREE